MAGFYMIGTSVMKELIILSFVGHTAHITTLKQEKWSIYKETNKKMFWDNAL